MNRMQRRAIAALTASLFLMSGCKKSSAPAATSTSTYTQDALAAGGTLNSDGSVTNANGTITQPNGQVVQGPANTAASAGQAPGSAVTPPSPAGSANQPAALNTSAPPPPPAAPVALTAPRGTSITIRTTEEISSRADDIGQRFSGVLERPVVYHGATLFERGTPVSGEVVGEKNKGTFKGAGDLSIRLTAIGRQTVHTTAYTLVNKGRGKRTGAFIGGGGGLGALIGGLAGGGKGALIGGLAGAGAGTAASTTGNKAVVIRPESVITFRLTEPVSR